MKKYIIVTLIAFIWVNGIFASAAQVNRNMITAVPLSTESENDDAVIDELWGTPILVYGGSLSEEQLDQTKRILGITGDHFDSVVVTGEDLVRFLGTGSPNVNMYSSAYITGGTVGSGIFVSILTPENITRITETQYTNAMITAGIADAIVYVASPVKVTGESALTGIYKAYADRGVELDSDRMEVAQEELETTSSIANDHADNEDFDSINLDNALIDIKSGLADIKDQAGELATDAQIVKVVEEALENNNLADILTSEQVNSLVRFSRRFQATDAIDSAQLRQQLGNLADRLSGGLQSIRNAANDAGFWSSIQQFFTNFVDLIRNLFSS